MNATNLVLLPGLDGTGKLFADFIEALPGHVAATPIAYPSDKFSSYAELLSFLQAAVPESDPFVLLAESFSTPLAIQYAATQPANLRALILCAGFVTNPIVHLSLLLKAAARPWLFKLQPPAVVLKLLLIGANAPRALLRSVRDVLRNADPHVTSARVREMLDCDARNSLSKLTIPTMYLRAANDRLISAQKAEEIRLAKPDIIVNLLAGPHMILQREPRKSAALVSDFIQKLGS